MTLVDKMAKAMYERRPFVKPWDDDEAQRLFGKSMRLDAIAALKAMREPTESMLEYGFAYHYRLDTKLGRQKAQDDWQAMIDQAIKEGEQ